MCLWLGDRDSNPGLLIQSQPSCRWTIPQSAAILAQIALNGKYGTDGDGNSNCTTVDLTVNPMIPEFETLPLVVAGFIALFLLIRRSRRKADQIVLR